MLPAILAYWRMISSGRMEPMALHFGIDRILDGLAALIAARH
jgi:hypothetical protein